MKKNILNNILIYIFLITIPIFELQSSECCPKNTNVHSITPKFTIRSQGTNAARKMVGTVDQINLNDIGKLYGTISITPEYTRAFYQKGIAECLFGNKLCDKRILRIQGSRVEKRNEDALLADYFYLPTDFSSEVTIHPTIQNFILDFNVFLGLDNIYKGVYVWLQAPLVWSRWNIGIDECVKDGGKLNHPEGYFATKALNRQDDLLGQFTDYAKGNAPQAITDPNNAEITTIFKGLECAKMCKDNLTKTALSEIRFTLGWNFLLNNDYHVGLNLQLSAPTGNNVKPNFLFDAQNGNDHHWELGGGLNCHYIIKRAEAGKHFGVYFDANITHMFKNSQTRCFDLCNKPLSRYMLAEKMVTFADVPTTQQIAQDNSTTTPSYQFNNEFTPVANITTLNVDVSVGINADIVAMFNYSGDDWSWDIGYNFWGRSCEKIKTRCDCPGFEENRWALKGDSHVYGFESRTTTARPLSATMSNATICNGDNFGKSGVYPGSTAETTGKTNPHIDNPELAATAPNGTTNLDISSSVITQINSSFDPILITQNNINFAGTKSISHKLFTHISYMWLDKENYIPYLGTGFEIEWASRGNDTCDTECNSCVNQCTSSTETVGTCVRCGLSQWGYWLKLGLSFD